MKIVKSILFSLLIVISYQSNEIVSRLESQIARQKRINEDISEQLIGLDKRQVQIEQQEIKQINQQSQLDNQNMVRMKKKIFNKVKAQFNQKMNMKIHNLQQKIQKRFNHKIRSSRRFRKYILQNESQKQQQIDLHKSFSHLEKDIEQIDKHQQQIRFRKINHNQKKGKKWKRNSSCPLKSRQDREQIDRMKKSNNVIEREMGYAMENGKVKTMKHQSTNQDSNLQLDQGKVNGSQYKKQQRLMTLIDQKLTGMRRYIRNRNHGFKQLMGNRMVKKNNLSQLEQQLDQMLGVKNKNKKPKKRSNRKN